MNNNVFQHFQGYELLIKTLEEGVRRYRRNGIPYVYGFVGLDVCNVVTKYLGNEVEYLLDGGYDKAFSKYLVIGEDLDPADYITCLKLLLIPSITVSATETCLEQFTHWALMKASSVTCGSKMMPYICIATRTWPAS